MGIILHPYQSEPYKDMFVDMGHCYHVIVCNRGWGKSYYAATAAVTALYELLALPRWVPNKRVYIIAPTYDQAIDIYYPILAYDMGLADSAVSASKDRGRFLFENHSELKLLSYESIDKLRGKGPYFIVWDEISSCTKGIKPRDAWEQIIQPAITSRWSPRHQFRYKSRSRGRALLIGTPKGFNFLYDASNKAESDPDWAYFNYDHTRSPLSDPDEIAKIKADIDPISFSSEYGAQFKESGNLLFYCFDRKKHVKADLPYFKTFDDGSKEDVNVGIDFNVGLMCASLFAVRGGQMHYLDEFRGSPNTEALANALVNKFRGHKIVAFPDPTGRARKTSAPIGVTDFTILRDKGITVLARDGSPPIVDSTNAVNRMLLNANEESNMFFHPRVKGVINSVEKTSWAEGNADSATIDKSEGVEHYSDSVRYPTEFLFPIKHKGSSVRKSSTF